MASVAVVHLMQLVEEELIQFSCRVLKIEEEKARRFHVKVDEVISKLSSEDAQSSYLATLKKELQALSPTDQDFMMASRSPEALLNCRPILARIADIVCEIDAKHRSLEALVASTSQAFAAAMLSSNQEFRRRITFFNEVAESAISLQGLIDDSLRKLEGLNNVQVVACVKDAADKAGDLIEAFLTENPCLLDGKFSYSYTAYTLEEEPISVKEENHEENAPDGDSKLAEFLITQLEYLQVQRLREARVADDVMLLLMQLLDKLLIPFLLRVLEIKEEMARDIQVKATMAVYMFESCNDFEQVSEYQLVALKEEIESLSTRGIEKWTEASELTKVLPLEGQKVLTRIPDVVCELDAIIYSLDDCLHGSDGSVADDSSAPLPQLQRQRELAMDLLCTIKGFKALINFFYQVAEEAIILHETIGTFLTKVKYSNWHQVMDLINVTADKAVELVEFFAGNLLLLWTPKFVGGKRILCMLKELNQLLSHLMGEVRNCIQRNYASTELHPSGSPPESSWRSVLEFLEWPVDKEHTGFEDSGEHVASDFTRGSPTLLETKDLVVERDTIDFMKDIKQLLSIMLLKVSQLQRPQEPEEYPRFGNSQQVVVDDYISKIIDELVRPPLRLNFVRIEGMESVDRTAIALKVFQHPGVVYHFHTRAWINCSSTEYVLSDLLRTFAPSGVKTHGMDIHDKGEILYRNLLGIRYLIVLDGPLMYEALAIIESYLPDKEVGSRILTTSGIMDHLREFPISGSTPKKPFYMTSEASRRSFLASEVVVGLGEEIDRINQLLRGSRALEVVTIVGMGGIGKTTLAKQVFHQSSIAWQFLHIAWVVYESTIQQLLSHLLHCITGATHGTSCEDIGEMLWRSLRGIKYLIVVDGLRNFDVLEVIGRYFPNDNVGSRILVTSRFMELPASNTIPLKPHRLTSISVKPLNEDQSWALFTKLVFGTEGCPGKLVDLGKRIAEKCGGLPLGIVVIANILSRIPSSYGAWLNMMDSVNSIVSTTPEHVLSLSYRYLPHHLKACLLYMGAFPRNGQIKTEKLINLWLAEGFLNSKKVAEDYLGDLIDRSLVTVRSRSFDGKIKECHVDNNLQEFCLQEAHQQNFFHVIGVDTALQGLSKQRRLFFDIDAYDVVDMLPQLPHLRSFVWLTPQSDIAPDEVILKLSGFKWLNVLDIYFLPLETFPEELLDLVNVRYLAVELSYELEPSISRLWKLQTLIVNGPWNAMEGEENPIMSFPFWKMPWLRHINVTVASCVRISCTGEDSSTSSNLETLSAISFSSCTEQVFVLMPNLTKLGVSETEEDFENPDLAGCFHNLSFLTELDTLKCSFYKRNGEARSFSLSTLPITLRKLTLIGSCLSWDEMHSLVLLPKLETLKLKDGAFLGDQWILREEGVFKSLKHLLIDNTNLVSWEVESTDIFPCLERLVLRSCEFLREIPWGIGELSVLQVIELHHCNDSVYNSAKEFEEQYGGPKIVKK